MAEGTSGSGMQEIVRELTSAFAAAREVLHATIELAGLEARRAGLALVAMVVCAMTAVMALFAGWLGLLGALILWLVSTGLPTPAAILATVLINVALAAILVYAAVKLSRRLLFESTRRQIASLKPDRPT